MKKIEEINQRLVKGLVKLKEIKEKYNTDSKKISELVQRRAGLFADEIIASDPKRKREIDELNKEIENLKRVIESQGPELIEALQKKLQGIELEKREEDLEISFERQKKLGAKIVDLSAKLIENLEQADSTNSELNRCWTEYASLSKVTKKSGIKAGSKTTRGSLQSLSALLGTLRYEFKEGKPRPSSEFSRMKI